MRLVIETLTPERAHELYTLALDPDTGRLRGQRPVRKQHVKRLAEDMRRGAWAFTHEAIAFSPGGRVLDGQHRLLAIIESGKSVRTVIAYDCDPSTFREIDIGVPRNTSDHFMAAGLFSSSADAKSAAALCQTIMLRWGKRAASRTITTYFEQMLWSEMYDGGPLRRALDTAQEIASGKYLRGVCGKGTAAWILWAAFNYDKSTGEHTATAFADQMFRGLTNDETTATFNVRRRLIADKDLGRAARVLAIGTAWKCFLSGTPQERVLLAGRTPAANLPLLPGELSLGEMVEYEFDEAEIA